MAADIGIKITAIDATKDAFNSANQSLNSLKSAATSVQGALASIGAGLSIGAFVGWVKSTMDAADAMNDMSQRVGIAVQDLAKYELATKQSGTTMEALAKGIKGLSLNLAEHGGELSKIGISAKSSDMAMQQLADIFTRMPDGIEKTTLAVQVFGKAGMEMIPMLNMGSKGLQEAAEKSAKYAAQMALMAPMADAFNDNMATLAMTSKIMGMSMVNDALPGLVSISSAMADASVKGGTFQGILAGISAGFENYKKNVREFWGVAQPNTGGASGSWGEPAANTSKPDDWLEKYKALMAAMGGNSDAKKAMADANRELDAQAKLLAELSGLSGSFAQDWGRLNAMYARGALSMAQLTDAQASLLEKQPAMQAADKLRLELARENTKAVDALIDAEEKLRLNNEDQIRTSRTMLEQLEFETRLLDMNAEQRAISTMERDLETKGIVKGTQAYDEYIAKLREAMAIKSGKEASITAAKDMADAQRKAAEESGKYWEDALMRAFESGKGFFQSLWDTIKNTLKTQVLKVLVSATGLTGMSAASAGTSAVGSFGSSALGSTFSNLFPAASATLSTVGNAALASMQSIVGMTGTTAQAATAAANGLAYGATGAGSMAASIGAAMPYIGAAILAYQVLNGNNTKSTSGTGSATQTFDATGKLIGTTEKAEWGGLSERALASITSMQSAYTAQAVALGIKTASSAFTFNSNTGKQGEGNNFAIGGGAGSSYYASAGEVAYSTEAMQLEASRAIFAALQGSDLPGYLAKVFDGLTVGTATQAQIDSTLAYGQSLKTIREALLETRTPLQILQDSVSTAFATLGTSAESFKTDFVAAIDNGINPENLLKWQQLGANLDALANQAVTASRSLTDIANERNRLQDEYDNLTMTSTQLLDKQRNALDASNRALFDQVEAIKAQKAEVTSFLSALSSGYEAQLKNYQDTIDKFDAFTKSLKDFQTTLGLGQSSTLTAADKYTLANNQFISTSQAANKGDQTALAALPDAITALLEASKSASADSLAYNRDFGRVNAALGSAQDYTTSMSAKTAADMAAYPEQMRRFLETVRASGAFPGFAVGTNFVPADMTANIHKGERIIPSADNAALMNRLQNPNDANAVLVAEIRELRSVMQQQQAALDAIQKSTAKTSSTLVNVTQGGNSLLTTPA